MTSADSFPQAHHLATFGNLGTLLKTYVQMYRSKTQAHTPSNIQSIEDMNGSSKSTPSPEISVVTSVSTLRLSESWSSGTSS